MLSRTSRILLVVALLAAVVYLLFGRRDGGSSGDVPARLGVFDVTRVDGVIVERAGETLRFARVDSTWQMTAPVPDVAEPAAVITLLDALEHADIARNLGDSEDLAPFGLDPPQLRITLLALADTLLDAAIGNRTVDDAWCYARTQTDDLLLVPTGIARAASVPVDAYRNQRVLDFQLRDAIAYELNVNGVSTVWTRRGAGWYTVAGGDTVTGDSVAVEGVLRRLRGLRVASFLPAVRREPTHRFAGISVLRGGGLPGLRAGFYCTGDGACEGFAEWSGSRAFVLAGDIEDLFACDVTRLRDRRLLQFDPVTASRIEVALPGASGSIVRTGSAWSFPNPALGRLDPERAADFVRALRRLKWTDTSARGATPPDLRAAGFFVTVTNAGGTILDEMRAESRPDGLWYVTSRSSPGARMIERGHLDALADGFVKLKTP